MFVDSCLFQGEDGIRYSPESRGLVDGYQRQFQVDLSTLPEVQEGKGFLELLASDGLSTSSVRSYLQPSASQKRDGAVNAPTSEILTPDSGMSFKRGATVVLHSSGWDLEDHALGNGSIVWTSDRDGLLGSGRLLSLASLSVGTHVITVTATDSSGLTGGDTSTIVISDRVLPLSAAVATRNAGSNPASYVAQAPSIGTTWNASVDLSTTGHTMAQVFVYSGAANVVLGSGQVLLVGGTALTSLPIASGPVASFNASIPNDMNLVGMTLYTQAVHLFGVQPFALSNAQDLTIGL